MFIVPLAFRKTWFLIYLLYTDIINTVFGVFVRPFIIITKRAEFSELCYFKSSNHRQVGCKKHCPTPSPIAISESIRRNSGCSGRCCWCDRSGRLSCQQFSTSLPTTVDLQQLFLSRRPETSSWQTETEREEESVCVREREVKRGSEARRDQDFCCLIN